MQEPAARRAQWSRRRTYIRIATAKKRDRRMRWIRLIDSDRELEAATFFAGRDEQRVKPLRPGHAMKRQAEWKADDFADAVVDFDPFRRLDAFSRSFESAPVSAAANCERFLRPSQA